MSEIKELFPEQTSNKEIEKKFLVKTLPDDLEKYPHKEIIQGYLAITEDGTEVRLRRKGNKYFQTVKTAGGEVRGEVESEITESQFNVFWPTTEGKRVSKTRYEIPHENGVLELDVYRDDLEGLVVVEKEFKDQGESGKFVPPDWFGENVTENKAYKNKNLAVYGMPKGENIEEVRKRVVGL